MNFTDSEYYRLRTQWLRFKSHLFDSLTGLPALPAVMDGVRDLIEKQGAVDVVYIDLGRSGLHDKKRGWSRFDAGVRAFAEVLTSLRAAGDVGTEGIVCVHRVRSDRFLLFLAAPKAQSGSHAAREQLLRAARRHLSTTPAGSLQRSLRLSSGSARVVENPLVRVERAIQHAVSEAMLAALAEREGSDAQRRDELHQLIVQGTIRTVFDPIVRLTDRHVIGHEALSRTTVATSFESMEHLFAFAETTEYLLEFERLCRSVAIRSAVPEPGKALLFLNTSPRAAEDPEWKDGTIDRLLREHGLSPDRVVIEITERTAVDRAGAFQAALKSFKKRGYRVAVDDMGAGHATLQSLVAVEPDFLKFDTSLVRDIDKSNIKRGLLLSLRTLAEKINARVIAEGVEREGELSTLRELGIELGQGYYLNDESDE